MELHATSHTGGGALVLDTAQLRSPDLAGDRLGEFFDELHAANALERRQALVAILEDWSGG